MNTLFIDTHGEVVVLAIYTDEKLMKKKVRINKSVLRQHQ